MNTIEEMAKAYANEKYGDYADAVGHFAGMEDFIAGYKAASPLRWVKASERLPENMNDVVMKVYDSYEIGYYRPLQRMFYTHPNNGQISPSEVEWLDEGNAGNPSDANEK